MESLEESRVFVPEGETQGEREVAWPLRTDVFAPSEEAYVSTGAGFEGLEGFEREDFEHEDAEYEDAEAEEYEAEEYEASEFEAEGLEPEGFAAEDFEETGEYGEQAYEGLATGDFSGEWEDHLSEGSAALSNHQPESLTTEPLAYLFDTFGSQYESPGLPGAASACPAGTPPGRLEVTSVPLLSGHAGTPPDLVMKWNAMLAPTSIDVVIHLHGHARQGRAMNLPRDKEAKSGLDFGDPTTPGNPGRTAPTLLLLPRGHFNGSNSGHGYRFPALEKPGAIRQLVDDALARFTAQTGVRAPLGKLIITAHSGGGSSLMTILRINDPDEVFVFDALYSDPAPLITWAQGRMKSGSGALRVLYLPGTQTAPNSEKVHFALAGAPTPKFRVERSGVGHDDIPRTFGWRLLLDSGANLPKTSPVTGIRPPGKTKEADGEMEYFPVSVERHELEDEESPGGDEALTPSSSPYGEDRSHEQLFEDAAAEAEAYEFEQLDAHENEFNAYEQLDTYEDELGEHEAFPSGLVLTPAPGATGRGQEHWDPNNVGLPLYDTSPLVRPRKIAPNFTVGELVRSGGQYADQARISAELVRCLQAIRVRIGRPVNITSGYRSWTRNVEVYRALGKKPTLSRHCSGQAADITAKGMTGLELAKAAIDACGDRIALGIGDSFLHIDVRGRWTTWSYLKEPQKSTALAEIASYRAVRGGAMPTPARPRPTRPSPAPTPVPT
ncbi:D-Ala-D-Ala carboxypeptidase family metallohydrolase, partial [Streptomyces sp. NPDC041003]|uniref:YcbK family protein n=1 Tax=Streptomyces sp. NPDC041003 TaxID=3155730 RepID=UPI0033F02FC4